MKLLIVTLVLILLYSYVVKADVKYIVYNDFKNDDLLTVKLSKLDKLSGIVINNFIPTQEAVDRIKPVCPVYISLKLTKGPKEWAKIQKVLDLGCIPILDAENYTKEMVYSKELGKNFKEMGFVGLLPENLGGAKYKDYDAFILGLKPQFILMERTYNEWKPGMILKCWLDSLWLRDQGIVTYIGIWPESLPPICAEIQRWCATWQEHVYWYSETKELPK